MKERTPILKAYDRVILRAKAMYAEKHGETRGAMAWFAEQIGSSRQSLQNWGGRAGIPPRYVPAIARITGLKKHEIRPDTILVAVTKVDWIAYAPQELVDRSTIYPTGRRRHGKTSEEDEAGC